MEKLEKGIRGYFIVWEFEVKDPKVADTSEETYGGKDFFPVSRQQVCSCFWSSSSMFLHYSNNEKNLQGFIKISTM